MIVGYARVSTDGQDHSAQTAVLKAAGAEKIYSEKISGAVTNRKALAKALAALERSLILARTGEGRARAMARGVRFGRKPKLSPFQIAEALRRREAGESLTDIARTYGGNHSTISRLRPRPPMPYLVAAE